MRRIEVLLERAKGEPVPVRSGTGIGEFRDLLSDRSQDENLALWFQANANSIEITLVISEIELVGLVKNAKFLLLLQIRRPLCGFRAAPTMVFLVEKVPITTALRHPSKEMTRLTAN